MRQKLITKQVEKNLRKYPIGSQDGKWGDAVCVTKFFHPWTGWRWYVLEADLESGDFFGIVSGIEIEYGYFSLKELESIRIKNCPVERDSGIDCIPLKKIWDTRLQEFLDEFKDAREESNT